MKNRYGNFIGGKYLYVHTDIGEPYYPTFINRSLGTLTPFAPRTDEKFEYTSNQGGMWGLNATFEFPKRNNRTFNATGLTDELDSLYLTDITPWTTKTVNISRFANRSARVVFRQIVLKDYIGNVGATDGYIDFIQVSGTNYGFEATTESFETTTTNSYLTDYSSLTWTTMASTATRDRFSRANVISIAGVGTSSNGNFAIRSNYLTAFGEAPNHTMWLRSPVVSLGATPTLSFRYAWPDYTTSFVFIYLDLQ